MEEQKRVAQLMAYYILDNPFFRQIVRDGYYKNVLATGIDEFIERIETILAVLGEDVDSKLLKKLNDYNKFIL